MGEWERSVCAVSERVEQKIRAKKEGKREKEKTIDAEPPRRTRTRQACKHAMAVDDPPLLVLLVLVPRSARIE